MCPCAQQQAESLMDGPGFKKNLLPMAGGYRNTLADTAGGTDSNPWAIDFKAPWSRGERILAAVGSGILVGTVALVMIRKPRKKK